MTFTQTNRVPSTIVALLTVVSLLLSAFPASFFVANAQEPAPGTVPEQPLTALRVQEPQVMVCHANNSNVNANNPFNPVPLDQGQGHGGHADDIIPVTEGFPNGQNLTTVYPQWGNVTGQQILDNDCEVDVPTTPSETGTLRVCKIVLDQEGKVTTAAGVPAEFAVDITGPKSYANTVTFTTGLTLTHDLLTDNGTELDAVCKTFEGVATGEYRYAEEEITNTDAVWAAPRYHDFFTTTPPDALADFTTYAVDGSQEDTDDNDGVANVGKDKTRTIAVVNQIERLPLPPVCENGDNLLENGSFEQPNADQNSAFGGTWEIFSSVIGWVVPQAGLEIWKGLYGGASDGLQNAELDGNQSVTISQTIDTIPGATYEIKFDFTPRPGRGPADNNVEARVNGAPVLTATGDGSALTQNDWKTYTTTFVATGATTDISFADMGTSNSFGGAIDNTAVCFVSEPIEEEPELCSIGEGEVISFTADPKKNNGQPVDANRRTLTSLDTIAPYSNFFGKDTNSFNPNDFFSLGITGELVYEFVGKVAVDQAGPDIAIWEITGGPTNQVSDEKAEVFVSEDGVTYVSLGIITGDGALDIAPAGLDFVRFVKLVDKSTGVQGANGDGFDVDAITIIEGSCSEGGATVIAHKIVCTDEADLPNYGTGQGVPNMTAQTAINWVNDPNNSSCSLVPNWQFEWTANQSSDPGDTLEGPAGSPWTTFGPTDDDGKTSVFIPATQLAKQNKLWFREVLKDGYIPFTHQAQGNKNTDNVSAEFYCHNDVLNYDNREFIDKMKAGETYYCVAWNVPEKPAQCELDIYSDEETLVEETNETAVATYDDNNAWTAKIPGATWIWATEQVENPKSDETYTFVETFEVTDPTVGTLVVAYDNWLKLTVNGQLVEDRKVNGYQDYQKQTYNILPYLDSGENRIEFEVKNIGQNSDYRGNPAGVLFHLSVEGAPESCDRTTEPEPEPGKDRIIGGVKWNDLNRDGVQDDGEPTLSGWTITATNGVTSTTTTTNIDGEYRFTLPYGTWTVSETMQVGWTQSAVRLDGALVDGDSCVMNLQAISPEQALLEAIFGGPQCDFGNYETKIEIERELITACKFDSTEDGVEGWGMTITNGETTYELTTGEDGCVSQLVNPLQGPWEVYEEDRDGWNFVEHIAYNGSALFDEGQVPFCRFFNDDNGDDYSYETAAFVYDESEGYEPEYYCDFVNAEETVTPDPEQPEPENRRSSRSSGTRTQLPTPQVAGAATQCIILNDFMQIAWDNNPFEVLKLQIFLNAYLDLDLPLNGDFDQAVADAVVRFQEMHHDEIIKPWFERGIVPHDRPTGFVYKTTRWKINDILCPGVEPYPSLDGETLTENVVVR